jgi:hypothetical protein
MGAKRKNTITETHLLERCKGLLSYLKDMKTVKTAEVLGRYGSANHAVVKALYGCEALHSNREGRGRKVIYVNNENLDISPRNLLFLIRKEQKITGSNRKPVPEAVVAHTKYVVSKPKKKVSPVIDKVTPGSLEVEMLNAEIKRLRNIIKCLVNVI